MRIFGRVALVLVVAGILLAISFGWRPWQRGYSQAQRDNWMIACTENLSSTSCGCLIDEAESRGMSYSRFVEANNEASETAGTLFNPQDPQIPRDLQAVVAQCDLSI